MINVGVFFGGASVEHEISVISAVQAMRNIDGGKYAVTPVYIAKNGEMYTAKSMTDIGVFKDIPALLKKSVKVILSKTGDGGFALFDRKKPKKPLKNVDIAFPIVHGTNCEDGSIAGWFELLGIPYIGCDVLSSAVGMDKVIFKDVLSRAGIPVLDCVSFTAKEWVADADGIIGQIRGKTGFPVIVKPVNLGSSVGISRTDDEDGLREAVDLAMAFSDRILTERAVVSLREMNCSVLGDIDECETSVIEEPVMSGAILSYSDKYMNDASKGMTSLKRKIPADIPDGKAEEITGYAKNTFKALGCCGIARIDFLMDTGDNDKVYVNEINTIPGSLSFYLWEPMGVKYKDLLSKMIDLGFKRARNKENLMLTYDTNILSSGGALGTKK